MIYEKVNKPQKEKRKKKHKKWSNYCSSLAVSHRLYAVAGSNGQVEENSVEMFDSSTGKWKYVASLPVRLSNIGKLAIMFVHKMPSLLERT